MDLIIKRFTLRYNGKDYKAGTVLTGLSEEEGKEIIKVADGDVEAVQETVAVDVSKEEEETAEDDKGNDAQDVLQAVDPKKTMGRRRK